MTLSQPQRTFLIQEQVIAPAIVNFVLNALIAWLIFRPVGTVPIWGNPGLVADVSSTLFILPLLTCLITTPLVKRAVGSPKLPAVTFGPNEHPWLRWLPQRALARAVVLGATTAVLVSPLALAAILPLGIEALPVVPFALGKGLLCALVATVVTPLAALYALAQASHLPGGAAAAP